LIAAKRLAISTAIRAAVALSVLVLPGRAFAQAGLGTLDAPTLHFKPEWRRSDIFDYLLIGGASAAAASIALWVPSPESKPDWDSPILFDSWVRDGISAGSQSGRNRAAAISDILLWSSVAHVLADAAVVAPLGHRAPDVGWQMLLMDAEAYSVSLLLNAGIKRATARARPDAAACKQDPNYDGGCKDRDAYVSFYSGHASLSATSAGLLCAQHSELSLYGGVWDGAACATGIAVASVTGALRIVGDRHWASDVITGHLVGFSIGYFLPKLLHFRASPERPSTTGTVGMLPLPIDSGMSFVAFGRF
jgi:membrane-associated phospholipid phosphatase